MMHRFFADENRSDSDTVFLTPEDAHHALAVLRLKTGDQVEVLRQRQRFLAEITDTADGQVRLSLLSSLPGTEPSLAITLFQGLPKGDKMDWVVQKAAEIGVSRIIPLQMQRCVVRIDPKDFRRKTERWQRIAHESCKQCGRGVEPEVAEPISVSGLPPLMQPLDAVMVPWEECGRGGPMAFVGAHPRLSSLGVVIGPEGGITPEEMAFLQSYACVPVTLGPRILRAETAGLAAVSAILALYGEME